MNIQSTSSKEKEIIQFILIAINITPLLPYSHSYSPLCLAGGPISAAETRLVWNMLQCCSAAELQCAVLAGRVSAANWCSVTPRARTRARPRTPAPRTPDTRGHRTADAETGAVFAHNNSLRPPLLLSLLVLLLVLLSRD